MATYLISYDLGAPETSADYKKIASYIDSFSAWMKPLQSQWFVVSQNKDAGQINRELESLTDGNDQVLVLEVTNSNWASYHLGDEKNNWLKNNL